jgi:nucleoside-diphosphate-sugar epimerase
VLFRSDISAKVSTKKLSDRVLKLASYFNTHAKEGMMLLNVNRNVSNEKAKQTFGWKPVATQEETIIASVESMKRFGLIK